MIQSLPINVLFVGSLCAVGLFVGILVFIEWGRVIGARRLAAEGEAASKGFSAVEGATFALLGLVLAFLFSGALARFEDQRHLVVEEANDIGTAWLRIDLLPSEAQPRMRELFRSYLSARIAAYQKVPDFDAVRVELDKANVLQGLIWKQATSSLSPTAPSAVPVVLLPALNAMFDITTTRTEAIRLHPPMIIFLLLGVLAFACSVFAGYDMASQPRLNRLHSVAFALVMAVTAFVIIDLEFPRLGLIRMTDSDEVLLALRKGMD